MQVNVNRNSEIEEIAEDVPLPPREIKVTGALIAIQQNSGLIQRCNECRRTVSKGICPVHGKTESYDDLRIKGVLDDGENFYEIILNEDNIKALTGIGLEEAKKIAKENLERGVVLQTLRNRLLGKYFTVNGTRGERYLIVNEIDFFRDELGEKIDELLTRLGAEQ
jgi:replication factor A1